jgi:glyoxylase-like metal-dependent hydrolase (beta-lactamase superfamily II)
VIHEVIPVGALQCNCSILGDEVSREAVVVDPGDDIPRILMLLARHKLTVKSILITHAHIDHIAGAAHLKQITGAPVFLNGNDMRLAAIIDRQAEWLGVPTPEVAPPDGLLDDGDTVSLGALRGTVLHTPGHTEGSVCLYLPEAKVVLAGDTLFAGAVGRTDLWFGDGPRLIRSIREKLLALPDDTIVVPGHGPNTTIGEERETNPFL